MIEELKLNVLTQDTYGLLTVCTLLQRCGAIWIATDGTLHGTEASAMDDYTEAHNVLSGDDFFTCEGLYALGLDPRFSIEDGVIHFSNNPIVQIQYDCPDVLKLSPGQLSKLIMHKALTLSRMDIATYRHLKYLVNIIDCGGLDYIVGEGETCADLTHVIRSEVNKHARVYGRDECKDSPAQRDHYRRVSALMATRDWNVRETENDIEYYRIVDGKTYSCTRAYLVSLGLFVD